MDDVVGSPQAGEPVSLSDPDNPEHELDAAELDAELDADADADSPEGARQGDRGSDDDESDDDELDAAALRKLRRENAAQRARARAAQARADELARDLWEARVASLGILADPTDLAFDAELLGDVDGIRAAAEALVERKPHLRRRAVVGGIGQASTGSGGVSLIDLLRANA